MEERVRGILGSTDVRSVLGPWKVWVVLDHVGVPVSDFERSKRFYAEALSPLGYELIMEPSVSAAGFGGWGKPEFWSQMPYLEPGVGALMASKGMPALAMKKSMSTKTTSTIGAI